MWGLCHCGVWSAGSCDQLLLLATAGKFRRTILLPLVRILLATGVMAVLLWFLERMVSDMASVLRLLILVAAGGGTYLLLPRCLARFLSIFCAAADGCKWCLGG